jgi:hypothetical protein
MALLRGDREMLDSCWLGKQYDNGPFCRLFVMPHVDDGP